MNLLINTSIAVNIALVILFASVCIVSFKNNANPKLKAKLGTLTGVGLFLYLILLTALSITGFLKKDYITASLIIFVILPFIIGHFANYKTLKIFSAVQLASFLFSLHILITIIIK